MLRSPVLILVLFLLHSHPSFAQDTTRFRWPDARQAAISLTFDDARESQVLVGTALLDQYDVKATFYVNPPAVEKQLAGWQRAVASGHEIGNHTMSHPCTGNFDWSRKNALEDYTLKSMRRQLKECNDRIYDLLHVRAVSFAYPCGQKFVGRGKHTKSYVPLVSTIFQTGRGWLDEAANNPRYANFAQLTGVEMDGKTFEQILPLIEEAKLKGQWLVLAGHEMGEGGNQTTRLSMLKQLAEYVKDPKNAVWVGTVGEVATFIQSQQ